MLCLEMVVSDFTESQLKLVILKHRIQICTVLHLLIL